MSASLNVPNFKIVAKNTSSRSISKDLHPSEQGSSTLTVATKPELPTMRDEILDLYGFLFRQRGFDQSGMTFEQFLLVIAAVRSEEFGIN